MDRRTWAARSPISKWAHIAERSGLAAAGGSCGLFVAAEIGHSNIDLLGSGTVILAMLLYGALGFYLGIDLPRPPSPEPHMPLLRAHGSKADAVELLSAAGTFLASVTAFVSVCIIILDEAVRSNWALLIAVCWATGATMQIVAGLAARARRTHRSAP